jgi:hypothetical protein
MSHAEHATQALDRLGAIILDDVGDGPAPADLAAAARAARDAVASLTVPALTQLSGLIAGVADAIAGGATEWNPALGGTLMAASDYIRHLASRADQFTDEDGEHLHHRAMELAPYASKGVGEAHGGNAAGEATTQPPAPVPAAAPAPAPAPAAVAAPTPAPAENPDPVTPTPSPVVPISELFYADGGPHIVRGGTPQEAAMKSDLLGKGIEALDNLTMKPIATPVTFGAVEVVPVETILYRGRAALERAAAIREQVKRAGGAASQATLEEMFDLIGLALKD